MSILFIAPVGSSETTLIKNNMVLCLSQLFWLKSLKLFFCFFLSVQLTASFLSVYVSTIIKSYASVSVHLLELWSCYLPGLISSL